MSRRIDLLLEERLTATRAAQLVGVHVNTFYRWLDAGVLPSWRLGRKRVVLARHVRRLFRRLRRGEQPAAIAAERRARTPAGWAQRVLDEAGI